MNRYLTYLLPLLLLSFCVPAVGQRLKPESLETRVKKAEKAFVGTLQNINDQGDDWTFARLKVDKAIKGVKPGSRIPVVWRPKLSNYNPTDKQEGFAVLKHKFKDRYWLRSDTFEPSALAEEFLEDGNQPPTAQKQQRGTPTTLAISGAFKDHMVLQRETEAVIWGTAAPGNKVSVMGTWDNKVYRVASDKEGKWQAKMKTPGAGGPYQIHVGNGKKQFTLKDVLLGDVWICGGQSNMQWKLRGFGVNHWKEDVQQATQPMIRLCEVPKVLALEEQDNVSASWKVCSPNSVLNFSAVGYFFGSRLHKELNVPIGLVSTNWGGSSAEAWTSEEVLGKQFPEFKPAYSKYPAQLQEGGATYQGKNKPKWLNQRSPSACYNSMIKPLQPLSCRGVIWYQGESNVKTPEQYQTLFPAMIQDWRDRWGQGDLPFYFVQIAPFNYKTNPMSAAFLREAQGMALSMPNTGMAVTMDVGNPTNIHPKVKKPVADRLALLALKHTYGKSKLVASGPVYSQQKIKGKKIRLSFTEIGGGLASRDGQPLTHFTIAGSDRNFVPAKAVIDGDTIVVQSPQVSNPKAVRFGWGSADMPNLMNKEGLPASSFRTDDYPIK